MTTHLRMEDRLKLWWREVTPMELVWLILLAIVTGPIALLVLLWILHRRY